MKTKQAKQALESVNARERNLDAADLDALNKVFEKFNRRFGKVAITIEASTHGGVPNSYGYRPQATWAFRSKENGFSLLRTYAKPAANSITWTQRVFVRFDHRVEREAVQVRGWKCVLSNNKTVANYYR